MLRHMYRIGRSGKRRIAAYVPDRIQRRPNTEGVTHRVVEADEHALMATSRQTSG